MSIDSWRASSTKAQVLTTTTSASSGPAAAESPSATSRPPSLSESTWFLGQPRVSTQNVRGIGADRTGGTVADEPAGGVGRSDAPVAAPERAATGCVLTHPEGESVGTAQPVKLAVVAAALAAGGAVVVGGSGGSVPLVAAMSGSAAVHDRFSAIAGVSGIVMVMVLSSGVPIE